MAPWRELFQQVGAVLFRFQRQGANGPGQPCRPLRARSGVPSFRTGIRTLATGIAFFVLLILLLVVEFAPEKINLQVNQVSPVTIKAPRTVVYEDKARTAEARRRAAEKVPRQYNRDDQVVVGVTKDVSEAVARMRAVQEDPAADPTSRVAFLRTSLPYPLPEGVWQELVVPNAAALRALETGVVRLVSTAMAAEPGVTQENLEAVRNQLVAEVATLGLPRAYELVGQEMVRQFLRPNAFFNAEETRRRQQEAMDAVAPVMVTIRQGDIIVGEGEVVTEEHMAKLQALGLARSRPPLAGVAGTALLVALLGAAVLFYLYQQKKDFPHHVNILGIVTVAVMVIGKGITAINIPAWPEFSTLFGYMVPLAAASMLVAILLDARLAILVTAVMSLLLGLMTGNQLRFGMVGFIGGLTGIYSVSKLSQRGDLTRAGIYVGAACAAAIFTLGLIGELPWSLVMSSSLILGFTNGLLSAVLTIGTLPYLENAFRITSAVKLLELANPTNPLLRRLLTEAPGTYHHSILVGNLAEAAAEAVGGDPLLVRVGAYYHDVGKIKRPYFFSENQFTRTNPHDKIAPSLSTLILTSHVKDGVELAREYDLPLVVRDIIEQHHGTSLVSYFYHKALENERKEAVSEEEFRYEGPKPQSKEAAIVMLADAVEAAVRSLQNPTPGRVEGLIRRIIKEKLLDGQLDESDLTLRDLELIACAFGRVLSGIFHTRPEYPEVAAEMERRKARYAGGRK
ncbi:MAG: HD family phosphohydrolase [Desulfotomaculales bacterium]